MLSKPITLHSGSSFKILLHKLDPINPDAPVTKIVLFISFAPYYYIYNKQFFLKNYSFNNLNSICFEVVK